jgi:hypothetical protein
MRLLLSRLWACPWTSPDQQFFLHTSKALRRREAGGEIAEGSARRIPKKRSQSEHPALGGKAMAATYALHESASGYALFETKGTDEISGDNKAIAELERFSKVAKLAAFLPFNDADSASKEITQIADGSASDLLIDFLKQNLPKQKKRQSVS